MEKYLNSLSLLQLFNKWKYHLISILSISIIASIVFSDSYFIKPKYKSYAVIYPSNLIPYSSETPTEQMLQIFDSKDLRDSVITKFNLGKHYELDKTQKFYNSILIKEFENNVTVKKSEYESVVIEVLDANPDTAYYIVKYMIDVFNARARALQRQKASEVLKIAKNQLDLKKKIIDSLSYKLNEIRMRYGIMDYKFQAKELSKQYYSGLYGSVKKLSLDTIVRNMKEKGTEFSILEEQLSGNVESLTKLNIEYENALRDVTKELTYTNLVSNPYPSDKKSYPIRWLIVVISTLATLFVSNLLIIGFENIQRRKIKVDERA